jgi:Lipocalin-like domain
MRSSVLVAVCFIALATGHPTFAQSSTTKTDLQSSSPVADKLVGAWRLVSVETKRANGEVIYPFYGKHPEGLLMYDRNGWMSVQIVSDPKPTHLAADSREDVLKAPLADKAEAIDGYYAYYGTWTVDPSGSSVTHHIQQSLLPAERGENVVRQLTLDGNRLTLVAKTHEMGEAHERKLVWERVPAQS